MTRLRIAQVAPLFERVPPLLYGGTERIVGYLADELVRRGHNVTLFASGDSRTRARLVASAARALRLDPSASDHITPHVLQLQQVAEHSREFDVIHCHVGSLGFLLAQLVRVPTLHTMHGRLDLPDVEPLFAASSRVPLVSISHAQRTPLAHLPLAWAGTVHHGLPLERYPLSRRGGDYLVFLGRISREKRPDLAIAVAKRVGVPLKIAAKVDPVDRAYFAREIEPLLHHPLIEFVGEIGESAKAELLGNAMALLFPIDWPEPFGLVMIEALACGTPVIARPCGSTPEVVRPGRTGFLADSVDELAQAVRAVHRIDRTACRRDVEARFSVAHMVDGYEALYRTLAADRRVA